jgi:hypothetical protein
MHKRRKLGFLLNRIWQETNIMSSEPIVWICINYNEMRNAFSYSPRHMNSNLIDWLIDWLVFNVQRAIFQLYSGLEEISSTFGWFGLWCLTPLSKKFQLYRWDKLFFFLKEIGVPGENHRTAARHWQTLSHNVVSSTLHLSGVRIHNVSGRW